MRKIDLIGQVFVNLTVVREGARNPHGRRTVICLCACGNEATYEPRDLTRATLPRTSCGCTWVGRVKSANEARTTHGMTATPEYNSWQKMRRRCENPDDAAYGYYGGRGIRVCERWQSFDDFLADMGRKPEANSSLDRIDVNGDYSPDNCRWASPTVQARNKRHHRFVEYDGRKMPLSEACEHAGVQYHSALYRLNRGQPWMPLPPPADGGKL